jgi:hypothetical protein
MYNNKENMYWEYKGSIFIFLNDSLHKRLFLLFVIILIIFFLILKTVILYGELPQRIIP